MTVLYSSTPTSITTYLDRREQRVDINGQESDCIYLKSGVPQGSGLLKCKVKFLADDTSYFTIVKDPKISASD